MSGSGAKAGSAKEKSTVTDTVPRSNNVTVCHCVGELWIIGGLALAGLALSSFKPPLAILGQSGLNIFDNFLGVKG